MKGFLRPLLVATVLAAAAAVPRAHAVFHFTLTENGDDVDILGEGTINTTDLTSAGNFEVGTFMDPRIAVMTVGTFTFPDDNGTHYSGTISGPSGFGDGGFNSGDGMGNLVGLELPSQYIDVPVNYTSGAPLSNSAVYSGQSFSSLGLTPGTYTYTWGTGINADSLVVQVGAAVPEPSTWAMVGAGALGLLGWTRRRTRVA